MDKKVGYALIGLTAASLSTLIFVCASTADGAVGMNRETSEVWLEVKPKIGRRTYFKLNDLMKAEVKVVE